MVANHFLTGLGFGLSLSIVSWMVGIIGGALLLKTSYFEKLSHLNFIPSKTLNSALGIEQFKWIVKNSYFRFLNQSIRVGGKNTDLASIRHQMTLAEISHLIGFLFVSAAALYQSFNVSPIFWVQHDDPECDSQWLSIPSPARGQETHRPALETSAAAQRSLPATSAECVAAVP